MQENIQVLASLWKLNFIQKDVNRLKVNFAWKLEEELFSSWIPDQGIKVKLGNGTP